jgi:hypothetical protein
MICEFVARMHAVGFGHAAGLSTVHINRTIRDLHKLGLVTWGVHSVTIHDWAGLAQVGQFNPAYLHPALIIFFPRIEKARRRRRVHSE